MKEGSHNKPQRVGKVQSGPPLHVHQKKFWVDSKRKDIEDWKQRWYEHGRSFREPTLRTETALSEYIWELKEEDQRYSISWHVIERTQSFNPITLQCKLCLSEIVNMLLLNPTQASLNKKSECYQFCRHRKKFLLAYSKPLALKGGALTYRYKR